jgi:hypothetical protein
MNIIRPPPCPPSDWSQLIECYREIADFKKLMAEIINEMITDGTLNLATKDYVDQQIAAVTQGVTDGSIAGPGEIGEVLQGNYTATTPVAAKTTIAVPWDWNQAEVNEHIMDLPAGDWQVSAQMSAYVAAPVSGYLDEFTGGAFFGSGIDKQFANVGISFTATTDGVNSIYLPTLVWSGSIAETMEIRGRMMNRAPAGTTYIPQIWVVAFRKR